MLTCKKELFHLDPHVHYLNNAYMSPNLKSVEMAGIIGVRQKNKPYLVQPSDFFKPVEQLKSTFAKLISCNNPDRIAIIPSASYGLSNVAKNIDLRKGKNIIIPQDQFPSNYYIWERLARENALNIVVVEAPESIDGRGKVWNQRILESINDDTLLVACGHVHWADGTKFDLKKIRERCTSHDALLIIDASQSLGALPFNVSEIRPDALVSVGYKWLFGPYGIGFSYFDESFDHGVPIEENWINRKNSNNFKELVNYQSEYKPYANRYSVGENSQFINVPMMQTALDQILAWRVDDIQKYSKALIDPYLEAFQDMGYVFEEEANRAHHLFGMRTPPDVDILDLSEKLRNNQIYVSLRGNSIRVATSVYNSKRDLDMFYSILHKQKTLY